MVATPQCSFPEADIAKGAQHLRGSMAASRDELAVRDWDLEVRFHRFAFSPKNRLPEPSPLRHLRAHRN